MNLDVLVGTDLRQAGRGRGRRRRRSDRFRRRLHMSDGTDGPRLAAIAIVANPGDAEQDGDQRRTQRRHDDRRRWAIRRPRAFDVIDAEGIEETAACHSGTLST